MKFDSTQSLVDAFRNGQMVVLADDDDENLGGVVMAPADTITADQINFMARRARGLICVSMTPERCRMLDLPPMVAVETAAHGSRFTVSIEAAEGVTTGISAADRAHTIRTAISRSYKPGDIVQPGHVFPLRAEPGGVLKRAGHTEGGCDLARLAGLSPSATLADILDDSGSLATGAALAEFAAKYGLPIGSIAELIEFRLINEATVSHERSGMVQTAYGEFQLHAFRESTEGRTHIALTKGDIRADRPTLVRVHVSTALRDLLATELPDKEASWNAGRCLQRIAEEGNGVMVLINQSEDDAHLQHSIRLALGEQGMETPIADAGVVYNLIGVGAQILRSLNVGRMRIMGPPVRYNALSGFGLEVEEHLSNP